MDAGDARRGLGGRRRARPGLDGLARRLDRLAGRVRRGKGRGGSGGGCAGRGLARGFGLEEGGEAVEDAHFDAFSQAKVIAADARVPGG